MKKKIIMITILGLLAFLGWTVKHYYFTEFPQEETLPGNPVTVVPNTPKEPESSSKTDFQLPERISNTEEKYGEQPLLPQSISIDKDIDREDTSVDLSEQSISINQKKEQGYELMKGVTVKHNTIQVQLDQDNVRTVEIQKDPPSSNNQVQVLVKRKF